MKKAQFLTHWNAIQANQNINPCPVAYKHEGSTYDQDGIRITGSTEFIDSVLSRLKDLLNAESNTTRLQVVYKQSTDRKSGELMDSFNCYVQVHQRGDQAAAINSAFNLVGRAT